MSGGGDRLLSCLLPQGLGMELQARLFSELGLTRVEVHAARGFIGSDPGGLFNCVEKEILTAITAADQADDIFEWIYHTGKGPTWKQGSSTWCRSIVPHTLSFLHTSPQKVSECSETSRCVGSRGPASRPNRCPQLWPRRWSAAGFPTALPPRNFRRRPRGRGAGRPVALR